MRFGILFTLLFGLQLWAQSPECRNTVPPFDLLDISLVKTDSEILDNLLHPQLVYGHSNGWAEHKQDLLNSSSPDAKVKYHQITQIGDAEIETVEDTLRTVRREQSVSGLLDGNPFDLQLKIMEVWICENSRWQLVARQSLKLPDKN